MKKLTFLFLSFVMAFSLNAQDGKKKLKEATKELATYKQNVAANSANLDNAINFEDPMVSADPDALNTKGELYNSVIDANFVEGLKNPNHKNAMPQAAILATDAYEMALAKAVKKGQTKDALKGLVIAETNLYNTGATEYDAKEYASAFRNFEKAIKISDVLKAAGEKSRLDDKMLKDELYYFTVIAGSLGEMTKEIKPYAMYLYDNNTDKPYIYQLLHEMNTEGGDDAAAEKFLLEGRKKFAGDSGLLFAEINYALKKGRLSELIDKLKEASLLEPDNLGIVNTLGSVNEQLAKKSLEAGDTVKAAEYNAEALKYYEMVMEKDPTNFDAPYNIGAFYYNSAAKMADRVNGFAQDYSAAGTKKYNAAKAEMAAMFEKALPYFLKSEAINPKDPNTLIALKEIYVRIGQMDKSKEYQTRYEALGKN
ncbi:MAG: hypothetical protein IPL23_29665 [Saprospiraceae bacterium]|nr:hypothetical protein [Saprospiraceae bacterium]